MRFRLLVLAVTVPLAGLTVLGADGFDPQPKYDVPELRKKLAYESLAERLEYETKHKERRVPTPAEAKETWKRLEPVESAAENRKSYPWIMSETRAKSLRILHTDEVDKFISRFGNGLLRLDVSSPRPALWELPAVAPIAFQKLPSIEEDNSAGVVLPPQDAATYAALRWPQVSSLTTFHDDSFINFVNPIGFGHIKDREHVSGFRSHNFRSMPKMAADPNAAVKETWAVRRLELVSLLKHEKPVVYVTENLPRMEDTSRAKTRPLNEFEESALKSLARGEDVIAEATTNSIRMMGSIRANNSCLKCHDVERGDLLGTFSYELQRDPLLKLSK